MVDCFQELFWDDYVGIDIDQWYGGCDVGQGIEFVYLLFCERIDDLCGGLFNCWVMVCFVVRSMFMMFGFVDFFVLWICVVQDWIFIIGDFEIIGWLMVLFYLLSFVLVVLVLCCNFVGLVCGFWIIIVGLLVFLVLNKQFDLQIVLIVMGCCVVWVQGWYDECFWVQFGFIGVLIVVMLVVLIVVLWLLWGCMVRNGLVLIGLIVLCGFVLVCVVGFYYVD